MYVRHSRSGLPTVVFILRMEYDTSKVMLQFEAMRGEQQEGWPWGGKAQRSRSRHSPKSEDHRSFAYADNRFGAAFSSRRARLGRECRPSSVLGKCWA
jgi:hypothetical protein